MPTPNADLPRTLWFTCAAYLLICLDKRPNKHHIRWVHPSPSISNSHHQDWWNSHHFGSKKSHKKSQAGNQTIFRLQWKRTHKKKKQKQKLTWNLKNDDLEEDCPSKRNYIFSGSMLVFWGCIPPDRNVKKNLTLFVCFPCFLQYSLIQPMSASIQNHQKETRFITTTKQKYPFWWPFNTSRFTAAFR